MLIASPCQGPSRKEDSLAPGCCRWGTCSGAEVRKGGTLELALIWSIPGTHYQSDLGHIRHGCSPVQKLPPQATLSSSWAGKGELPLISGPVAGEARIPWTWPCPAARASVWTATGTKSLGHACFRAPGSRRSMPWKKWMWRGSSLHTEEVWVVMQSKGCQGLGLIR